MFVIDSLNKKSTYHLDVIEQDGSLLFYEGFDSIVLLDAKSEVYVRKSHLSESQIKNLAWSFLYQQFLQQRPVRADIYYEIKNHIPKNVKISFFEKLSIEQVCSDMNIKRHHFDYHAQKIIKPITMPKFHELIDEVIHGK